MKFTYLFLRGEIVQELIECGIIHRAGVPTQNGENYLTYIVHEMDESSAEAYTAHHDLSKFRRWKNCGSDYAGNGHPEGVRRFCGNTAQDITEYVILGKELMLKKYEGTDKNKREILTLPSMAQFRTIRHLSGPGAFDTSAPAESVRSPIGTVGDFRYAGKQYAVPYSALYHSDFDNLLAAGRIINVADADSWEVARVIPVCALTGEFAGKTAAAAAAKRLPVSDVKL